MRWIVSRSLRFRWLVLFAAAAIMLFGLAQIPDAKVDVFPEFAPPRVEVQTIALGNSSTEVEERSRSKSSSMACPDWTSFDRSRSLSSLRSS